MMISALINSSLFRSASFLAMTGIALSVNSLSAADAVEEGRESLDGGTSYPWYDAESDTIRKVDRVDIEPFDPKDLPQFREAPKAGAFSGIANALMWMAIIAIIVAIIAFLIWAFMRSDLLSDRDQKDSVDTTTSVDQIENLPFTIRAPQGDLLEEARRHYEAGNFKEAVIYLYSYQLVELDKRQMISLEKGKTNRQYLWEVDRGSAVWDLLGQTMTTFEDVFFGDHSIDRQQFERCWNRVPEFQAIVQEGAAV